MLNLGCKENNIFIDPIELREECERLRTGNYDEKYYTNEFCFCSYYQDSLVYKETFLGLKMYEDSIACYPSASIKPQYDLRIRCDC